MKNDLTAGKRRMAEEHEGRRHAHGVMRLLSVLTALGMLMSIAVPAAGTAGSGPELTAAAKTAQVGETISVTVSASAPESETVVLLSAESGAACLSDDYAFSDEQTSAADKSGNAVTLHRVTDAGGNTEYWFLLAAGTDTTLPLTFAAADTAAASSAVLRASSGATLADAQQNVSSGASLTLSWTAAETNADAAASAETQSEDSDPVLTAQAAPVDLSQYITGATFKDGSGNVITTATEGESIVITISYNIPDVLTSDNRTVTYQLPAGITIQTAQAGGVFNLAGDHMGTYTISTDGLVTITFDADRVGAAISGTVSLSGSASNTSTDGKTTTSLVIGTSTLPIAPASTHDLSVEKSNSVQQDGKIHYTVTVSTTKGTENTVSISDVLTASGVTYDENSFAITGPNGETLSLSQYPITFSNNTFSVSGLPQLAAGQSYTVTYTATPDWSGTTDTSKSVTNAATATSGGDTKTGYCWNTMLTLLSKYGSYNATAKTITWTATVNAAHENLNGYTLSDTLRNPDGTTTAITGTVQVSPQIGGSSTITLPYTFESDDHNTYTITYTTTPDTTAFGTQAYSNDISLTKDGKTHTANSGNVDVVGTDLTKQYDSAQSQEVMSGKDGGEYTWTSTLTVPTAGLTAASSYYSDFLDDQSGKLLITADTAALAVYGVKNGGTPVLLTEGTDYTVTFFYWDASTSKYTQEYSSLAELKTANGTATTFTVRFVNDISQSTYDHLTITYGTYADYSGLEVGASYTYKNAAQYGIDNNTSESANAQHSHEKTAAIAKQGKNGWSYTSDPFTVGYDTANGALSYRLLVNTDGKATGVMTITDTLPAGVTYDTSSLSAKFYFGTYDIRDSVWESSVNATVAAADIVHAGSVTTNADGTSTLTFTVDNKYETNALAIYYSVTVTDQKNGTASYTNNVTMGSSSASQTTSVTHPVVTKTAQQGDGTTVSSNIVTYRVVINPGGADLLPSSDTLTLSDALTYTASLFEDVHLVQSSVKLYRYDSAATNNLGKQLDSSYVQYTYNAAAHKTTFTIPDSMAVVLEYQYYAKQTTEGATATLSNTASLTGASGSHNIGVKAASSSATAVEEILTVYKVDAADNAKKLRGATFRLDAWNSTSSTWTETGSYTTDSNGTILFDAGATGAALTPSLALYELVETAAPTGYALDSTPYYFVWGPEKDAGGTAYTVDTLTAAMADTVTAAGVTPAKVNYFLYSGGTAYIQDVSDSITVKKVWLNTDGTTDTNSHSGITIQLYENGAAFGAPVTLNSDNGWTWTWMTGLTAGARYTVTETVGEVGYAVSYDNNEGISSGTITVKNQGAPVKGYVLPDTGGPGTAPFIAGGTLLILAAALLLERKRKSGGGDPSPGQ